ncbi:MAG TPA: hypothetical protein VFB14_29405 [Bryobacteraceae bacterium]|jgi:hypothetical protein|nr:hypothetical protein [Bryobacteraceae bacterium]
MKQALHIFKKDVRYLRYEIAITLIAVLAFAIAGAHHISTIGVFLPVLWWFLIARVVYAEPLPGYRQFWITRPYERKSLFGAKALFILCFVNLPLLIADAIILLAVGLSVAHHLGGLLWTQVLLTVAFVLPAAAFAVMASGLGELVIATLLIVVGILIWLSGLFLRGGSPWFELEWVRTYCLIAELAAAAAIVVLWQYARRNTLATRFVMIVAAIVLLASYALLPWTPAFALQTHLSRWKVNPNSIRVALDSDRKWLGRVYTDEREQVIAELPLRITGLPAGTVPEPNGLTVSLRAPDGAAWTAKQPAPSGVNFEAGIPSLRAAMGKDFYAKVKNQPLQLQGTLYLTLYGNGQTTNVPLDGGLVPVHDVGVCSANEHFVRCQAAFRPPLDWVTIRIWQTAQRGPRTTVEPPFPRPSYSPFPADLGIDPVYQSLWRPNADTITAAQVQTVQPIAYLECKFDIEQVRLSDFVAMK